MKKRIPVFLCLTFLLNISTYNVLASSSYEEYGDFNGLYDAYLIALEEEDEELLEELERIASITLQEEIAEAEKEVSMQPFVDPDRDYYLRQFNNYFGSGYWETRSNGLCLTLYPKMNSLPWTSSDKNIAWNATYAKFGYNNYNWNNTACMKEQFYCHARLPYTLIEREWNLEPSKTSVSSITCN